MSARIAPLLAAAVLVAAVVGVVMLQPPPTLAQRCERNLQADGIIPALTSFTGPSCDQSVDAERTARRNLQWTCGGLAAASLTALIVLLIRGRRRPPGPTPIDPGFPT